jgi:hypothetical protein
MWEQDHMRLCVFLAGVLASVVSRSSRSAAVDLHGTARAGDRPEPHAVVWLDALDAGPPAASRTLRLDKRNVDLWPRILAVRAGTVVDFPNNALSNTAGARIRMLQALTLQVQLVRQSPQLPPHRSAALDVGITYSIRRD